ncbi:Asparagine synthetase [glutamine-hydrolyzing] 1 [Achromobacter ruhlandii]|uniref:asparagine synthase (glutamine-hydrolyzing) n=1 Tax=Achromobacter ruhlandii TaxID=72557 RepID=UPI0014664600|nr:asparagine synthase (glutamine-hydrolyzing) [Achromobacter ruhlandii]CAB3670645.1 Asparagine synthetase [glutamine-hydrolyzing] 1 [Achromobacter ruhlandii]
MCGIFGYFDRDKASLSADTLSAMAKVLHHRGPDENGVHAEAGAALGNCRLSIIDVKDGHQPFISDDGQIILVQNGEIFNHVELAAELATKGVHCRTHSDTEVLLRLYETEGISFVSKLNGMFAIAILDKREQAMYLIRDRIGVKPLYIAEQGKRLVFGSEIKALLLAGIPAVRDEEALHHYLTYNYVPAPYTMFKGVRHLMPGHWMKISAVGSSVHQWWDLAKVQPEHNRSESDWIEEFNAILDDAVRIRLRSDVPIGAFLSGGVDSSSVVGLMARHMSRPVQTFCIGFDDPRYDEASFAQAAADRFGTQHTMERVSPNMLDRWPKATWYCDQPHGDVSFLPTWRVSQLAAKHVKVVLTGDGGDELFAGYDKYLSFFSQPGIDELDQASFTRRYFDSISLFSPEAKIDLYRPADQQRLSNVDSFVMASDIMAQVPHQDRINQALFLDMQLLLSGNNLVKPDRMGMAESLEARTPFLDYRMMEFAFRMPGTLKLRDGVTKYLYKKAVAPMIGDDLAYRRKQMFTVPVGDWFRNELAGFCKDHLVGEKSNLPALFKPERLRSILDDHISGSHNYTREIRALIAQNLWEEVFLRNTGENQRAG